MSSADEEQLKRKYREFMEILPLTMAIAGLPTSDTNRNYTPEQMQTRAQVLLNAYRLARQTVRDAVRGA